MPLNVYTTRTVTGVSGGLLGELGGSAEVGHQQQVFEAEVAVRDPMLLQVLQAIAELQEKETDTTLVDLWLTFMKRAPLPHEVGRCLLRDLRGDDHHSLSFCLLVRRRLGWLRLRRGRRGGQRDLIRRQHALRDASEKVAAVLLEVEVGRHALLHRQTVEVALLRLHGWTLTDLEKHKGQWEERMKRGRGWGSERNSTQTGKGAEPRNIRKEFLLVRFQGQCQFSSCSHSSEMNIFHAGLNKILNGKLFFKKTVSLSF